MTDHMDVLIVCLVLVALSQSVEGDNITTTLSQSVEGDNITTTTEADPCKECDLYSTSCYKFTSATVNYSDAQTACESCGGYLASINDDDEYKFITSSYSSVSVTFWIGLWRTNLSGDATTNWEWQDGTELTINKWYTADGEPNGNSQCGLYTINGFTDTRCGGIQNYVCETPNPTTTTAPATTVTTTPTTDSSSPRTGRTVTQPSDTTTDSEDVLIEDISTTVANGDVEDEGIPVWVWIIVAIGVVVIIVAVICVALYKRHKKKAKAPIPETSEKPPTSEEPKNAEPSFPPTAVKYRPNYETLVLENEDEGKVNNGFENGPPDVAQANGGSGEQVKPVVNPTDIYAEVRKKDSSVSGAEVVTVENTLFVAGDFKDQ